MNKLKEILELGWEVRAKLTKEGCYMLYAQNKKKGSILTSPPYHNLDVAINDLYERVRP
jgi:hypothetical protein